MRDIRIIQVGNIVDDTNIGFKNPQRGRVYSVYGLAPTMQNWSGGGGLVPKILVEMNDKFDVINPLKGKTDKSWFFEQQVYDKEGIIRALKSTEGSGNLPKIVIENMGNKHGTIYLGHLDGIRHQQNRVFDADGCAPTISAGETMGRYLTRINMEEFKTCVGNKQRNPHRGSIDGISPTITAACGMGGGMTPMLTDASIEECKSDNFMEQMRGHVGRLPKELEGKKFRIRKLTPRECFRLMGVGESDIDAMQASGLSNSAQYKLAGNSIVAGGNYKDSDGNWDGVLFNLFRKMFIETENEEQQLTLF